MTLFKRFKTEIIPEFIKEKREKNPMNVPRLSKIVINVGLKEALSDKKVLEKMSEQLSFLAGQKPMVTFARKAIAGFKLRKGDEIGLMVTLRGRRMYDFFEKLVTVVLPAVRDFHGVSKESFDGKGNYSLGFSEQIVFPEIEQGKIDRTRGFQITIVTTAETDREGEKLLALLGMPFKK